MMVSKTKISAEGFEKVEITAKMAEVFGLPKKAVGKWAVVSKDYFEHRLRKVRLDGYLPTTSTTIISAFPTEFGARCLAQSVPLNLKFPNRLFASRIGFMACLNSYQKLRN